MGISRRTFVRAAGAAGASALVSLRSAQILARGREAAWAEAWASGSGGNSDLLAPGYPSGAKPRSIRLSSNENPIGPPRVAVEALIAGLADAARYPYAPAQHVSERIAAHHDIPVESLVVGSGSGEILRMAVYAFVNANRPLVTGLPSFEDPTRYCELVPAPITAVPLTPDLKLDLGAMADRARGAGLVFVCNPNNPTGTVHGEAAIREFVERVLQTSPQTTLLIDEAYHDYVEDRTYATAVPLALTRPNVLVCRTFSKLYGMAGLRLGYAVGQPATVAALRRHRLANSVNALVAPAAAAALGGDSATEKQRAADYVMRERARNHDAREFTRKALAGLGYESPASDANFIMVDVRRDVREFQKACAEQGVLIGRPFPPLLTHARISIGTIEEMSAAVGVFRKVLAAS
jgi:histidinol-phosphate aminotransferase